MTKALMEYKRKVRKNLHCGLRAKMEMLRQFDRYLKKADEENASLSYEELESLFGPPEEMAEALREEADRLDQLKEQTFCGERRNPDMDNAIEISHLTKCFAETIALRDVSVCFERGKIHGILGRNGSGKTVLFKCILGLFPVTSGEITVLGQSIGDGKRVPKGVGAIIENPGFLPNCNGYENLKYLMELSGKADPDRIREVISLVGLDPDSKKHVGKYSLGMRQRLGIAQALMEDPELLILDEPMNGLDKGGVNEMRELFLNLKNQGKTILIASHNPEDTRILCDTLHEMDVGILSDYVPPVYN